MLPFVKAPLERGKGVVERTETKVRLRQPAIKYELLYIFTQLDNGVKSIEVIMKQFSRKEEHSRTFTHDDNGLKSTEVRT